MTDKALYEDKLVEIDLSTIDMALGLLARSNRSYGIDEIATVSIVINKLGEVLKANVPQETEEDKKEEDTN